MNTIYSVIRLDTQQHDERKDLQASSLVVITCKRLKLKADRSAINGEALALLGDSSQKITIRFNAVKKGALLVTQLPG